MGWFLSSSPKKKGKKKTSAKRSTRKGASPEPFDPESLRRAMHWGGGFVAVVGFTIAWVISRDALMDYASRAHPVQGRQIVLVDQPAWMTAELADPIASLAAEELTNDRFDQQALADARAALLASPWIKQVHQVQRVGDGTVQVTADYRTPVVAVRDMAQDDAYYLVDIEGVVLAGPWRRSTVAGQRFQYIAGVASRPPAAGEVWPGEDVQAGIDLAALLAAEPYADQILGYHVYPRGIDGDQHDLVLSLVNNASITWGLPPEQGLPIEAISAAGKMQHLHSQFERYNRSQLCEPGAHVFINDIYLTHQNSPL